MASEIKVDTISEKTSAGGVTIDSVVHKDSAVYPSSADGGALGSASNEWSDLFLADSSVIKFGADQDTTLTHTDGTGLTLNSTNKLCFNDASQFVQGSSATVLSIGATDEIDLTATAIDINGTCDISGTFSLGGTNITTTAAEINLIDGGTARGTTALASGDGILINDGGTMRMTNVDTVKTFMATAALAGIDDQSSSNDDQITISDSAVIINEDSDDLDFRVESNSNTHALFIDGDADSRVQVGSATSVASASITSDLQVTKANGFPAISINAFKGDDTTGALVFTKSRNTTVGSSTIVADNDPLGKIIFAADDGSDYVSIGAEIKAMINGTPGGNDVPTELIFSTTADGSSNPTGRMYIAATGYVGVADSAPEYYFNVKYNQKTEGTTSGAGLVRFTADNSATNSTNWGWQATYNDSAFMANDANNPAFKFHNSGIGYADATWNDNAFDYAELFKWKTPLDSDNAVEALWGMSVVLDGDFVRIAEAGEEDLILGVVRPKGTTASHGDGCHWQGKYLKDVWGKYLTENYTKVMWNDQVTGRLHSYHSDEIPAYELDAFAFARDTPNHYLKEENFKLNGKGQKIPIIVPSTAEEKSATNYTEINHEDNDPSKLLQRRRYNPDYDEDIKYIMREDRPREWVLIGLLGQVPIRDTAIIPTHWKKMKNLESGIDKYFIFNK